MRWRNERRGSSEAFRCGNRVGGEGGRKRVKKTAGTREGEEQEVPAGAVEDCLEFEVCQRRKKGIKGKWEKWKLDKGDWVRILSELMGIFSN